MNYILRKVGKSYLILPILDNTTKVPFSALLEATGIFTADVINYNLVSVVTNLNAEAQVNLSAESISSERVNPFLLGLASEVDLSVKGLVTYIEEIKDINLNSKTVFNVNIFAPSSASIVSSLSTRTNINAKEIVINDVKLLKSIFNIVTKISSDIKVKDVVTSSAELSSIVSQNIEAFIANNIDVKSTLSTKTGIQISMLIKTIRDMTWADMINKEFNEFTDFNSLFIALN